MLEQLRPLEGYFTSENFDHPDNETVANILQMLREPLTRVYLQFLQYLLNKMNEFNTIHQKESPQVHNLPKRVNELVRDLAANFMDTNYVRTTNPLLINPTLTSQYLPLQQIYLGNKKSLHFIIVTHNFTNVLLGPLNTETIEEHDEETDINSLREKCRDVHRIHLTDPDALCVRRRLF